MIFPPQACISGENGSLFFVGISDNLPARKKEFGSNMALSLYLYSVLTYELALDFLVVTYPRFQINFSNLGAILGKLSCSVKQNQLHGLCLQLNVTKERIPFWLFTLRPRPRPSAILNIGGKGNGRAARAARH